jgi:hypothetical protein
MSLLPIKNKHGKTGYIDQHGEIIIKPQYQNGYPFSNGFARVTKGNGYYYINEDNQPISQEFDYVSDFPPNGIALVGKEEEYFYINTKGDTLFTPPTVHNYNKLVAKPFIGEFAPLMDTGGHYQGKYLEPVYALINQKGELIKLPFLIYQFHGFSEGIARVKEGHNKKNMFVSNSYIDWQFNRIEYDCKFGLDFKNGAAGASRGRKQIGYIASSSVGFINKEGNYFISPNYYKVNSFLEEGFAVVQKGPYTRWTFIDKDEKTLLTLPQAISDVREFSEGLCPVKRMGFWGFMDKKGEIVIPAESSQVEPFKNGFARITHKYGSSIINTRGERVLGDRLPY